MHRCALASVLWTIALPRSAPAQETPAAPSTITPPPAPHTPDQTRERGTWQLGAYVASARSSPNNGLMGSITDREHLLLALQANTTLLRVGALRLNYVVQLLPIVRVTDRWAADFNEFVDAVGIPRIPGRSYAAGIAPFGIEVTSPDEQRVSAFLSSAAGGLLFTQAFPDVTGRLLNFTLEAGGGFRIRVGRSQWAQRGYKYHHLSNAGSGFANPGLDGNLFYAGYQWAARLPR